MTDWLAPVRAALDDAPSGIDLFLRDDDGGWRDDRLLRLLDLFAELALPVDVALIPADVDSGLAAELAKRARLSGGRLGLHQHGRAHCNHEPAGRKCEFGPSRSRSDQLADIEIGRAWLDALLPGHLDPIFTPPWNRCTTVTGDCLVELGFRALSRESRTEPLGVASLVELPVQVDWFAHRKRVRLTRDQLAQRIATAIRGAQPVGLMFHHALMDEAELGEAASLLRLVAGHPLARARPMIELVGEATGAREEVRLVP